MCLMIGKCFQISNYTFPAGILSYLCGVLYLEIMLRLHGYNIIIAHRRGFLQLYSCACLAEVCPGI